VCNKRVRACVQSFITRARAVDPGGKKFVAAELGFFLRSLTLEPRDWRCQRNYAVARMLLHHDYMEADKYFYKALTTSTVGARALRACARGVGVLFGAVWCTWCACACACAPRVDVRGGGDWGGEPG
jgi:hypothetical protein